MINDSEKKQMESLAEANVRMMLLTSCLQNIRDLERDLNVSGDIEGFYDSFLFELTQLTKSSYGAFGLFDNNGRLQEFFTTGIDEDIKIKISHKPVGKGILEEIYRAGESVIIDNISEHPASCGFPEGHPPMASIIGMPLNVNGQTRGIIYLTNKNDKQSYNETDELIIKLVVTELEHVCVRIDLIHELADKNVLLEHEKNEQTMLLNKINEIQTQLLQSEKMASIGQLAAGVAHEINNPVGYVNSNVTSLDEYVNDLIRFIDQVSEEPDVTPQYIEKLKNEIDYNFITDDIKQLLSESKEGINRVKKIVHDLKDFSHVDEEEWQWADLHKGIESTLNVVNNEIKYKAKVVREYGDIPDVECISSQINQVFMNLFINAAHAIEEQGEIKIRSGRTNDKYVWVEVSDTGKGIKDENLNKLFDPFFTTKPVGQGTGLGLSLSYGIIKKHGGKIDVKSELNKGTSFTVTLPVCQEEKKVTG